jgi:hypothetical protein
MILAGMILVGMILAGMILAGMILAGMILAGMILAGMILTGIITIYGTLVHCREVIQQFRRRQPRFSRRTIFECPEALRKM